MVLEIRRVPIWNNLSHRKEKLWNNHTVKILQFKVGRFHWNKLFLSNLNISQEPLMISWKKLKKCKQTAKGHKWKNYVCCIVSGSCIHLSLKFWVAVNILGQTLLWNLTQIAFWNWFCHGNFICKSSTLPEPEAMLTVQEAYGKGREVRSWGHCNLRSSSALHVTSFHKGSNLKISPVQVYRISKSTWRTSGFLCWNKI